MNRKFFLICILFFFCGCQTVSSHHKSSSVETDKDAMSAVKAIANSLSGKRLNVNVYYCPVDGERFSARVKVCPEHHVLLKKVEE